MVLLDLVWRIKFVRNRNDDDREINHHGRPVEVGEAETRPGSTVQVVSIRFLSSFPETDLVLLLTQFLRLLIKILLL